MKAAVGVGTGRSFLLGIAGKSGCGKTALAQRLFEELADLWPIVLALDRYYLDLSHLSFEERCRWNFDLPQALDWPLIGEQLVALKQGRGIYVPVYDFSTHTRSGLVEKVTPGSLIVLEGLFALDGRIRHHLDGSVFIDLADRTALERRLNRDVRERGRTSESVMKQYREQVQPAYEKYVAPNKALADLVLQGDDPLGRSTMEIKHLIGKKMNPPA